MLNRNLVLILIVLALSAIGLLALYTTSLDQSLPFFKQAVGRQLIWIFIGIILSIIITFINSKVLFQSVYIIYAVGIVLLLLPFLLPGTSNGSNRWISIGIFNLQPSEIMKLFFILAVARYLSNPNIQLHKFKAVLVPLILCLIPLLIVLNQPDLGTSLIYFFVLFPLLYWSGVRMFYIFVLVAPFISIIASFNFYTFFIWVVALIAILYFVREKMWVSVVLCVLNISLGFFSSSLWNHLEPYQQKRILTFFNPELDPRGAGYQVLQSQTAIGSGGIFGRGFGQGTQTHLKFLPEQHTDFVFSVLGEEYGFIGVFFVLLLFLVLTIILINLAYSKKDRFSSLILIGIASIFTIHIIINVGMTIGLMPVTGLPLPFLSYGGSFTVTCFILIGLALNANSKS
jgi:rod shape determining protein RodA